MHIYNHILHTKSCILVFFVEFISTYMGMLTLDSPKTHGLIPYKVRIPTSKAINSDPSLPFFVVWYSSFLFLMGKMFLFMVESYFFSFCGWPHHFWGSKNTRNLHLHPGSNSVPHHGCVDENRRIPDQNRGFSWETHLMEMSQPWLNIGRSIIWSDYPN